MRRGRKVRIVNERWLAFLVGKWVYAHAWGGEPLRAYSSAIVESAVDVA